MAQEIRPDIAFRAMVARPMSLQFGELEGICALRGWR
jgi:hypothetical protein